MTRQIIQDTRQARFAPGALPETPVKRPRAARNINPEGEPEPAEAKSLPETETQAAEPSAAILPGMEAEREEQIPADIPAEPVPERGQAALPISVTCRHRHRRRSFGLWRNIGAASFRGLPEREAASDDRIGALTARLDAIENKE